MKEKERKNEKTDKKSILIIILLILLLIITIIHIVFICPRYVVTVGRAEDIVVAKWNFEEDNKSTVFNVELEKEYSSTALGSNTVAPGTQGSFVISLNNASSDAGVDYEVNIGNIEGLPANMKLYTDESMTTENQIKQSGEKITGKLKPKTVEKNLTIYWKWDYMGSAGDVKDNEVAGKKIAIPITIKGTQTRPQ